MFMYEPLTNLKERFLFRLDEMRLNQVKVASMLDINPQSLTGWFKRENIPVIHLFNVARLLKCSPEWLVTGHSEPDPAAPINADAFAECLTTAKILVRQDNEKWSEVQTVRLAVSLYEYYQQSGEIPDIQRVVQLEASREAQTRSESTDR